MLLILPKPITIRKPGRVRARQDTSMGRLVFPIPLHSNTTLVPPTFPTPNPPLGLQKASVLDPLIDIVIVLPHIRSKHSSAQRAQDELIKLDFTCIGVFTNWSSSSFRHSAKKIPVEAEISLTSEKRFMAHFPVLFEHWFGMNSRLPVGLFVLGKHLAEPTTSCCIWKRRFV